MKKLSFIFNILKRRTFNILLLSGMFSALLLIFMVGFSIKDIFYDYLRSSYGNIADMQIKLKNLPDEQLHKIDDELRSLSTHIDILYGYEDIFNLTVKDEDDSILTKEMPTMIRGVNFKNKLYVELDSKRVWLDIVEFNYDDKLKIKLSLDSIDVKDKNSLKFIVREKAIELNFCTNTYIENGIYTLESTHCKDNVDYLFKRLYDKDAKSIDIDIDGEKKNLKIVEIDEMYRTLVLEYSGDIKISELNIDLEEISVKNSSIQSVEVFAQELIIVFKREENLELEYKRYIAEILQNYINYNRFMLNVKHYAFADDIQNEKESYKEELVWLNELTDFLDMVTNKDGNSAIASAYLANDLNNLGILDNFTIHSDELEFNSNIRSTFNYNPEKLYEKNILFFNIKVLRENLSVPRVNNFIDIYLPESLENKLSDIKELVLKYDPDAKFIMQDEIIPSIAPKKKVFKIVVFGFSFLIFLILFISMYVVLRQFYSNFESELALLKLFGVNQPYQTYINLISFLISSILIYFVLCYEQSLINEIVMKYFFTSFDFDITNYLISMAILSVYIFVIYLLEIISIKKLNLIKGQ